MNTTLPNKPRKLTVAGFGGARAAGVDTRLQKCAEALRRMA
jgi:hypothetical protein